MAPGDELVTWRVFGLRGRSVARRTAKALQQGQTIQFDIEQEQ